MTLTTMTMRKLRCCREGRRRLVRVRPVVRIFSSGAVRIGHVQRRRRAWRPLVIIHTVVSRYLGRLCARRRTTRLARTCRWAPSIGVGRVGDRHSVLSSRQAIRRARSGTRRTWTGVGNIAAIERGQSGEHRRVRRGIHHAIVAVRRARELPATAERVSTTTTHREESKTRSDRVLPKNACLQLRSPFVHLTPNTHAHIGTEGLPETSMLGHRLPRVPASVTRVIRTTLYCCASGGGPPAGTDGAQACRTSWAAEAGAVRGEKR